MSKKSNRQIRIVWAFLAVAIAAAPVAGQDSAGPTVPVPQGHWVYDMLDRAASARGSGLAGGPWLPGRRPATADVIFSALDTLAAGSDAEWARLATGAREWLESEYTGGAVGWQVLPGLELREATGAGETESALALVVGGRWSPLVGLSLFAVPELSYGVEGWGGELRRGGVSWRVGTVLLAASRENIRYGRGAQGGVVLGDESVLDGVQVALAEPLRPGGLFRWLGSVDGSVQFSRIGADAYGQAAAFLAGEVRVRPHPRVQLDVHRTALVAPTSPDGEPIGVRDVAYLLIGNHGDYEDQRVAIAASFRATLAGVDLVPYAELGLEDSAGMDEDPGLVMGLQVPVIPWTSRPVGLRYEYVAFGRDARVPFLGLCCYSSRNFYRHTYVRSEYRDAAGNLLGHPLGGYGHQHLVEIEAPLLIAGAVIHAGAFSREREGPHVDELEADPAPPNLLHDVFPGRSRGGYVDAVARWGGAELSLGLSGEWGDGGWDRLTGRLGVRWLGGIGL